MANYRGVIVGAGGMGRTWGKNLKGHSAVQTVGWVDIRPEAAAEAAAELELTGVWTGSDLEKCLSETKPDFVVDVTIPEAHHDVTLLSLAAGVPVLGEKPMASSMEEAREMVAASEKAGKLYMVSQSRRYDGRIQAYKKLITENLGALGILNSDFYIGAHFGGFRDEMDHVLILDMAIHTFDAARYLCDSEAVSVYCEEFNPSWSWFRGNACATAIFEMANGLRYTYRGAWCAEGRMSSWESDWRAVGEKGTALWNGHSEISAEVLAETEPGSFHSNTEPRTVQIEQIPGNIAGSLRDFLNALETGATPMGECHDNIKSLAMVFGAIESAKTGQRAKIQL